MAGTPDTRKLDLWNVAAATGIVIALSAAAILLYYLIDLLLLLFLGIVIAAALQPWHLALSRWGVPKAFAVLLIYLIFLGGLGLVGLLVLPVLVDQVTTVVAEFPAQYGNLRTTLRGSTSPLVRIIGERLPPLEALVKAAADLAPNFYQNVIGFTASLATMGAYLVTVLATALYWTLELPRLERLIVSFVPAGRRAESLNIWHEIEFKLGAFVRGQAVAMLAIGLASAVGYALIGLPNVLVLSVLAGLFEAVPLIGPILAAVPAVLVALPLGLGTVALVIGWSILLQSVENNVLIPRIMSQAVGMSALVGMFAVLAFGTLYGILGVFIAIPLTAVFQVLLDRMLINIEPLPEAPAGRASLAGLLVRMQALRQQARRRLRERDTRMGIDPATGDHVADAVDHKIEEAIDRVENSISVAQDTADTLRPDALATIVDELRQTTEDLEEAVGRVDTMRETQPEGESSGPTVELSVAELSQTTEQVEHAVTRVETVIATTQEASGPIDAGEGKSIVEDLGDATEEIKEAIEHVDTMVAQGAPPGAGRREGGSSSGKA